MARCVGVLPDPAELSVFRIPEFLERVPEAVLLEELVGVLGEVIVPPSANGDERRVGPSHPHVGDCSQLTVVCWSHKEAGECLGGGPRGGGGFAAHGRCPRGAKKDALENEAPLTRSWVERTDGIEGQLCTYGANHWVRLRHAKAAAPDSELELERERCTS